MGRVRVDLRLLLTLLGVWIPHRQREAMTTKWRLVATLNSRAREAMRDRREIVETKPPSEYFVGVQARYMGKAIAYKDAARLVAGMPENTRMKEVDVLGPVL